MHNRLPIAVILSCIVLGLLCSADHTTTYIQTSGSTCPADESCFTLPQLAQYSHTLRNSNDTVLFFMDGNHVLNFQLIVINVTTINITGNNNVSIECMENANFKFTMINEVVISNLTFFRCGSNVFQFISELKIQNSYFYKGNGSALILYSITVTYITDSSFISNNASSQGSTDGQICGGAIHIAGSGNLIVSFSKFEGNLAEEGGALYASFDVTNINITQCRFLNNTATTHHNSGIGGAVVIADSTSPPALTVIESSFSFNTADYLGGSIYATHFIVSNCSFAHNTAEIGGSISIPGYYVIDAVTICRHCTFSDNIARHTGGALDVSDQSFIAYNNTFYNNQANIDGGAVNFHANGDEGFAVTIANSAFIANRANRFGAAVYCEYYTAIYLNQSVLFILNQGGTGAVYLLGTKLYQNGELTHSNNFGSFFMVNSQMDIRGVVNFLNSTINNKTNRQHYVEGGAITAYQSMVVFDDGSSLLFEENHSNRGGAIWLTESSLDIFSWVVFRSNRATIAGGGIYCHQSQVTIHRGHTTFEGNTAGISGGAMHASGSLITLNHQSVRLLSVFIEYNNAVYGGGLYLETNAKVYINSDFSPFTSFTSLSGGRLMFIRYNSAKYGGGVYVDDNTDSGTCVSRYDDPQSTAHECTFQLLTLHARKYFPWEIEPISIFENTAQLTGPSLYGGLLDRCTVSQYADIQLQSQDEQIFYPGLSYLHSIAYVIEDDISSLPVQVCFCSNGYYNCSLNAPPIFVKKGETFTLSVVAVDQVESSLSGTINAYIPSQVAGLGEGQLTFQVKANCNDLNFEITSEHDSEKLILYAEGPCKDIGISQRSVDIVFLPCTCPIGFEVSKVRLTRCVCQCDSALSSVPLQCDISSSSITKLSDYWITHVNMTRNAGYIIYSHCPFDYCLPSGPPIRINLNIPNGADAQCNFNHSGLLCGGCPAGLSLSLGSSRCMKCSNHWLFLLVPFMLAGLVLVAFLLYLNLTVAVGTINGLIFYANIIAANSSTFLPFSNPNLLTVFIAWLNFDLGLETCFFNGMNEYAKVWLQFAFPAYVIFLIILIIVVSEHSVQFSKLFRGRSFNPVGTMATLVLLSYAKLIRTIITVFSFAIIYYPDGTKRVMWLADGNVQYLQGKHVLLFIAALLILLFGMPYTVLLFSWQWLLRLGTLKWTRNVRLTCFMDAYNGPYVHKYRYWTGLLLFMRVALYLTSALNVSSDPQITLFSILFITISLLTLRVILGVSRIYKSLALDVLETTFLLNTIIFSAFAMYFIDSHYNRRLLAYFSSSVTFIQFLFIVAFHFFRIVRNIRKCHSVFHRNQQSNLMASTQLNTPPSTDQTENTIYNCLPMTAPTHSIIEGIPDPKAAE